MRVQQCQLIDFLFGRQQITLHTLGKQGQRIGFNIQAPFFQTASNPLRQSGGGHGFGLQHHAFGRQRAEPLGLGLRLLQLRQHDHGYGVFGQMLGQGLQRIAAVFTRLAVGNMDFQQFQIGKQARAARRLQ